MMMGLRLIDEGVSDQAFQERFGETLEEHYGGVIQYLMNAGLLYWKESAADRALCLTRQGTLLGNQVFLQFV
jgi:oxygen-independent coproporphyrinogen-3 oxidase